MINRSVKVEADSFRGYMRQSKHGRTLVKETESAERGELDVETRT